LGSVEGWLEISTVSTIAKEDEGKDENENERNPKKSLPWLRREMVGDLY
jgi:hypothetical protein